MLTDSSGVRRRQQQVGTAGVHHDVERATVADLDLRDKSAGTAEWRREEARRRSMRRGENRIWGKKDDGAIRVNGSTYVSAPPNPIS